MIETERLRLLPLSPEQLLALIDEPDRDHELSGFPLAPGLREFFVSGDISPDWVSNLRAMREPDPWRLGFAVVDPAASEVIGMGAFKGPADSTGMVEMAYGVAPGHQGRGYATEVARALIAFALHSDSVKLIRAHTLAATNPSTSVLTKCGFCFVGEVIEPEDGLVWRWELPPSAMR